MVVSQEGTGAPASRPRDSWRDAGDTKFRHPAFGFRGRFLPALDGTAEAAVLRRRRPTRSFFLLLTFETIGVMDGVRMDAWLWAARFFKTRTLAKKACDLGRARSNEQLAKAAREVRIGDMLRIITEGGEFEVKVLGVSDVRGPASEAQKLYSETDASKEMRAKAAAERRAAREFEILSEGRPSKRDRRRIIQFRGRG